VDDRWKIVGIVAASALIVSVVLIGSYLSALQTEPLTPAQRIVGCAPIPVGNGPIPAQTSAASGGNASKPPNHWFNFTLYVPPANLSLRFFWLNLTNGSPRSSVEFPPGDGLEVISHKTGAWEATFNPSSGWTYLPGFGPSASARNGDLLSIFWTGADPSTVAGDTLLIATPCGTTRQIIT
jgi:hypothetical protein